MYALTAAESLSTWQAYTTDTNISLMYALTAAESLSTWQAYTTESNISNKRQQFSSLY